MVEEVEVDDDQETVVHHEEQPVHDNEILEDREETMLLDEEVDMEKHDVEGQVVFEEGVDVDL